MGLDLDYIDGQTPLDEQEKDGLLIPTIYLNAVKAAAQGDYSFLLAFARS